MDGSLIVTRWPFSPFATAIAAGALFAFCVALLKQRYVPRGRRHSAPARFSELPQSPEASAGLYRTVSESVLHREKKKPQESIQRLSGFPSISNFPAFDGRLPTPTYYLSRFPFPERPFSFSDDLINLENRFKKIYQIPSGRLGHLARSTSLRSSRGHSSLPNFGIVSGLTSRSALSENTFPSFLPFSKHLRSSHSLTKKWKSVSLDPLRFNRTQETASHCENKFVFTSDFVLLPGTLSFRRKCYSTAFEFSRLRGASLYNRRVATKSVIVEKKGIDSEPGLLSESIISVRRSESIPTELSRLEKVSDTSAPKKYIHYKHKNGKGRLEIDLIGTQLNSSNSCNHREYSKELDSGFKNSNGVTNSQLDSSEVKSTITRDEQQVLSDLNSFGDTVPDSSEVRNVNGASAIRSETNDASLEWDSRSIVNKTCVNGFGLRRRKNDHSSRERSVDTLGGVNAKVHEREAVFPKVEKEKHRSVPNRSEGPCGNDSKEGEISGQGVKDATCATIEGNFATKLHFFENHFKNQDISIRDTWSRIEDIPRETIEVSFVGELHSIPNKAETVCGIFSRYQGIKGDLLKRGVSRSFEELPVIVEPVAKKLRSISESSKEVFEKGSRKEDKKDKLIYQGVEQNPSTAIERIPENVTAISESSNMIITKEDENENFLNKGSCRNVEAISHAAVAGIGENIPKSSKNESDKDIPKKDKIEDISEGGCHKFADSKDITEDYPTENAIQSDSSDKGEKDKIENPDRLGEFTVEGFPSQSGTSGVGKEDPSVCGICQGVEGPTAPRAAIAEVEKSINSGEMSYQEHLDRVQEGTDKGEGAMTPRKSELSFAVESKQTIRIDTANSRDRGAAINGKEKKRTVRSSFRLSNVSDVTVEGEEEEEVRGGVAESDVRSARRQMDRGTGERWSDGSAPASTRRYFESCVTSDIRVSGEDVRVVSSVTSDVWSDYHRNGKTNEDYPREEVRVVSSVTSDVWEDGRRSNGTNNKTADHVVPGRTEGNIQTTDVWSDTCRTVLRDVPGASTDNVDVWSDTCKIVLSDVPGRSDGNIRTTDNLEVWSDTCKIVLGDVPGRRDEDPEFRPTFEEYMPEQQSLNETIRELKAMAGRPLVPEESPPRVGRLLGLLSRDEERRAKAATAASIGEEDGEWERILRDVLASVSELEQWEREDARRRRRDVSSGDAAESRRATAAELHPHHHSDASPAMEEEAASPKGETPTKIKSLRFKLDPDIFDVPSDDSFYEEDDPPPPRVGWRRQQPKYRTFSALEVGSTDEPVKLVSVHASVVPAGQKMVARPVGIDLRVRLTEERQSKRAHVGNSPSQAKRRSPVSDARVGWCQELSPVTENVDWRETFTSVPKEEPTVVKTPETKPVPNGILKTPSPKVETVTKDSSNPFKVEAELTNGHAKPTPEKVTNGMSWNHHVPRKLSLPRKKFEPDPEAIERITGYKIALAKPPLPPPVFHNKSTPPLTRLNRAEIARKQYLDSKAALATSKQDGGRKFQQFLAQAQSDRARIVTSVPDLNAIEKAVNEKWAKERASVSPRVSPAKDEGQKLGDGLSSRGSTPDDAWSSYVQSFRKHVGRRSQSLSYLETDVDLLVMEDEDKWRSTSALDEPDSGEEHPLPADDSDLDQSREDLDDSGRARSEHELRIQRSLQSMPLPDWYKRSDKPKTGFLLKSAEKEKKGWAAAKSLASSTSSLASCGLKRPVRSLRSSRENIPWSRGSPDGPALSLALAKAFREPYLGWRARTSTTSSGVSSSSRTSPPSWCAATTDDDETNGGEVSFDGEDAFGRTSSEDGCRPDDEGLDDTGADAATVSMDTGDLVKLQGGEDTCDDINNMSMDTCEMFDAPSPQADTGDDIDNLSTDTTDEKTKLKEAKMKRYSYSQSIYHSEWEDEESRGDRKGKEAEEERESSPSSDHKVIWIESSFVGSRTTTSIVVLPEERTEQETGNHLERPASR